MWVFSGVVDNCTLLAQVKVHNAKVGHQNGSEDLKKLKSPNDLMMFKIYFLCIATLIDSWTDRWQPPLSIFSISYRTVFLITFQTVNLWLLFELCFRSLFKLLIFDQFFNSFSVSVFEHFLLISFRSDCVWAIWHISGCMKLIVQKIDNWQIDVPNVHRLAACCILFTRTALKAGIKLSWYFKPCLIS